jgi:alpha-N-arabinofuranosidase
MTIPKLTRREFTRGSAALLISPLIPRGLFGHAQTARRVVIRADSEIGLVRPEFHGHFAEHLGSCVYGGIWVGRDSPIPNINGYRRAAVDYLKELGIPVLRWPGGCFADDYHWRDGIGPAGKRPKTVNIHWGNYVEDNSFGTHEFIGFCRLIGAEPYLAANVGSGTPEEMRGWIEYCNYPSGSTLAEERAANGSPEPFRVRYWGIGNENWGCGGAMQPEVYADHYRRFANYARNFGDTRIYPIACGPNGNDLRWSRGVLEGLEGRLPSGFAMHYYSSGSQPAVKFTAEAMQTQLASFLRIEQAVIQQRALLDAFDPNRRVGLFLDEWGVWDRMDPREEQTNGRLWQQATLRSAVAAGLGLNLFNRQADRLFMCNIAQMVNVLQSVLLTDGPQGNRCVRTTNYWAFMLFKPHRGKTAVRVDTEAAQPPEPPGRSGRREIEPDLSISASRRENELIVSFVNPRHDAGMQVDCALNGVIAKDVTARILHHPDFNAYNAFDAPDLIVPRDHPARIEGGSRLLLDLPAVSLVTATVRLG